MRALFKVMAETRQSQDDAQPRSYTLQAAMPIHGTPDADDPEVNAFWSATPSGKIDIFITNPAAFLKPGVSYYVDFTERPS